MVPVRTTAGAWARCCWLRRQWTALLYLGIFDLHGESRGFLEAFLSWQKFGECLPGDVLKLLFDSNSYVCATAARALVAFGAEGAKTLMDRRQWNVASEHLIAQICDFCWWRARLLDEDEDDQLDVESSVLQRIMLDAMQDRTPTWLLHCSAM